MPSADSVPAVGESSKSSAKRATAQSAGCFAVLCASRGLKSTIMKSAFIFAASGFQVFSFQADK